MTIYYVNPVSGSNSSNGLSWANAWLWPPGNGTAVVPGDEIRIAKSQERTLSGTITITQNGSTLTGYTSVYAGDNWVIGGGGGSLLNGVLTLPNSHNVPANTKLMYIPLARTQTAGMGIELALMAVGIPSSAPGGNLRVRICSDAAGGTPIFDLEGPTWQNGNNTKSYLSFLYAAAATLNFTMGSIAVYSVSAFTTAAAGETPTIEPIKYLRFTTDQSDTSTTNFIRRGSAVKLSTPPTPACGYWSGRADIYSSGHAPAGYSQEWYPEPAARIGPATTYSATSGFTHYKGLPFQLPAVYEAPLNYSGTSVSRIKISGGWDTGTNTQTGYTNLAIDSLWHTKRKGAFVFSSGAGHWIDYERLVCQQTNLCYFDYTVTALNGIRFFDCTLGSSDSSVINAPSIFASPAITAPVAIDNWYMERCNSHDWFTFSSDTARLPSTSFVVNGNVELVDTVITQAGAAMAEVPVTTGNVTVRSSVAGEKRSMFVCTTTGTFRMPAGASGTLSLLDTVVTANLLTCSNPAAGAASSAKAILRDVTLSNITTSDFSQTYYQLAVGNYADLTIDGYAFHNSKQLSNSSRPINSLIIDNAATFNANNPGAVARIGGPVYSSTPEGNLLRYGLDGIDYSYPPALLDFASAIRPFSQSPHASFATWPGLVISKWAGALTLSNFKGSYIHFGKPDYVAGTYWPDTPQAVVDSSCTCKVSSDAPTGVVRSFSPQAFATGAFALGYQTVDTVSPGVCTYGAEVDSLYDQNIAYTGGRYRDRRSIGAGIRGTNIPYGFKTGTYYAGDAKVITLEESATLNASVSANTANHAGLLLRKPSGWFLLRRAAKSISASTDVNIYGKRTLTMDAKSGFNLARLDVLAGTTINLVIRVRCVPAVTTLDYFRCTVIIPPCTAYTTELAGHYIRKNFTTNAEDTFISFAISPQKDGEVYINLYTYVALEVKDFSADVV